MAAELEAAKKQVEIAKNDFDAETDALVSGELEAGLKQAAEIKAETDRKVAELKKQTADLQAQITKILGKAEAEVVEATQKAEASRQKLLVDAYGGADAFKLAQFAQGLPDDLSLEYRVTGLGTWWTDAGSNLDKALAPAVLQKLQTDAAKDAAQAAPKQAVAAPAAPLQAAQKP